MKIFLLDTSLPINSRNEKILHSLAKAFPSAELHRVAWNRAGKRFDTDDPFLHVYDQSSPLGHLWTKARNLLGYRRFVRRLIRKWEPEVVIASHWDTLVTVPRLDKHRQKQIYENLDIPTGRLRPIFCFMEGLALKHTDLIIHASRFFKKLYPQPVPQIVLENKPSFPMPVRTAYSVSRPLRVAYIGNVRYKEILFNLIDAVRGNDRLHLTFHGDGVEYEAVRTYSRGIPNVEMTGAYDYGEIARVYEGVDVIWAVYPSRDFNVKYAISNKFFESVHLGIPAIFAQDTLLGSHVKENGTGLVVNPYDTAAIRRLLSRLADNPAELERTAARLDAARAAQTTWDEDFEQLADFLKR